ncbi:MAG: FGGY-family carbohydrate kinase [Thermotogota bacterium]
MSRRCLVGVDIGTFATKSVVVALDGRVLGDALVEYGIEQPHPSWAEQWPQVWEDAVCSAIRGSLAAAGVTGDEVAGVGISGLYGGSGIPVDAAMKPLRPCLIWMDRRATEDVAWIREHVDVDRMFDVTGNFVDTYFGYPKILWLKRNEPQVWRRVHKFVPPSTYVAYRLTGALALDYSSAGNLGGLFDIHRLRWSEEMSAALGIPLETMPETLVASTAPIGEVTTRASRIYGLAVGTPVVAGGIDAPMATLSAGAIEEGDNVAMMGTSTCWGVIHHGERLSKNLVSMPHVVNGEREIYTWGGAATSGGLIHWFRDQFAAAEVAEGKAVGVDPYQLLDSQAKAVPPGSDGLVVLPYFMGERAPLWDPLARGMVLGLSLYHTKGHVFRAMMEAGAYSLRHSIEVGEAIGLRLKAETCVVGGPAKSPLWMQILADVTGRRMVIPAGGVGAPLADALLAGIGVGLFNDHRVIRDWIGSGETYEPDAGTKGVYDRTYALYREFYENTKDHIHELAAVGGAEA